MNITLAHTLLQERGYSLEWRDEKSRGKPVCRVYATRGQNAHFLCNFSVFPRTTTKAFREMIARLEAPAQG